MTGPVTLVLLPGLDGTAVFLQPLLAALPANVRPVVVTFPQVGGDGYPELLALIQREVAGLGEFYVLGWSFAGPLALMLAAAKPERVRGVILSASFVGRRAGGCRGGGGRWSHRSWGRGGCCGDCRCGSSARAAMRCAWPKRRHGTSSRPVCSPGGCGPSAAVDAREALRSYRGPALDLAASDDRIVPPHCFEEIARERPSVTLTTISGRHLAMYTNPQAAARAILDFIAAEPVAGN